MQLINFNEMEYKTCNFCSYDIVDDNGNIMEHECISLAVTKDMLDARAWFRDNDIPAAIDDGSLFIEVNSYEIMVDPSEVSYRAELWKEYNNEGAHTPS